MIAAAQLNAGDKRALIRALRCGRVSIRVNAARRRKLWDLGLTDNDEILSPNGWDLARAVAKEMENDGKTKS